MGKNLIPASTSIKRSKSFNDVNQTLEVNDSDSKQLANYIYQNVVGGDTVFEGPYGPRKIVYCDYIASGKPLDFIERFINKEVLPYYGNTHSTTNVSSARMTMMREESRKILKNAFNASNEDVLIFAGSGSTGAIDKLVGAIGLGKSCAGNGKENVFIFVSLQEHHSNLLPWRESGATVITIEETLDGKIDLQDLESKLILEHQKQLKSKAKISLIGCFTAASNVTGQMNDDITITALLHKYGALSFWDYAAAAPYVKIDMNPKVIDDTNGFCKKDAIYFSCHKFIGGPQTPGILIAKKKLFKPENAPVIPGGGSVLFVSETEHCYLKDIERKEEGGTQAIVESIRAGLVIQLKETVGIDFITARERHLVKMARKRLGSISNLVFLGNGVYHDPTGLSQIVHLPILSFLVRAPPDLGGFLHYNFVCTLLNDLFGIQARGGCACAGPYSQRLLGISQTDAKAFTKLLREDEGCLCNGLECPMEVVGNVSAEFLKPGFTRLSLPWFFPDDAIDYILDAMIFIAEEGWKFMIHYAINLSCAKWSHITKLKSKNLMLLEKISYEKGFFEYKPRKGQIRNIPEPMLDSSSLKVSLQLAYKELSNLMLTVNEFCIPDQTLMFKGESERLRWSILPIEAKNLLMSHLDGKFLWKPLNPFKPKVYLIGSSKEETIGSLHGGKSKVQILASLHPVQDQVFVQKSVKNLKPVGSCEKLAKKPLSGLWPMEKFSMSKSINNMSMVALECSHPQSQSHFYDYDHAVNKWSKLTIEEKMISYLMKEYIASNRKKIFS